MATNTTDHAINSTQPNLPYACSMLGIFAWQQNYLTPTTFIMIVFAASVEALTCPFTILLNALVILAVKRKRHLRKKSHVLLACLAGTDLFVGAVVQPLVIASHIQHVLGVGHTCLIDKIAIEITYTACGASFLHLVVISGERYIGIKHALRYETLVTTYRLTTAVAAAWAVPVILTLISLAFDLVSESVLRDQLMGIMTSSTILSGVLVVSFCQVAVLLESRRHRKHIKAHQVSESNAKEFLEKDKAARTTAIIVGTLCLCFAPQIIYGVTVYVKNVHPFSGLMHVIDMLAHAKSLINPIIYCVRTQEFRRAFTELLHLRGSPQINTEVEERKANRSRGRRQGSKDGNDSSHKKEHMAWPDPVSHRGSRSRSLELSKKSSQKPRNRRTNSV